MVHWNDSITTVEYKLSIKMEGKEVNKMKRRCDNNKNLILLMRDELEFLKLIQLTPCDSCMLQDERDNNLNIAYSTKHGYFMHGEGCLRGYQCRKASTRIVMNYFVCNSKTNGLGMSELSMHCNNSIFNELRNLQNYVQVNAFFKDNVGHSCLSTGVGMNN